MAGRAGSRVLRAAFASFLLLVSSVARPAPSPETGPIELTYVGREGDQYLAELLSVFQRRHPNIKVFFGQAATRRPVQDPQRLLCAIAGGTPPDVVDFDRYAVGEWAARGAFVSLQTFYERDRDTPNGVRDEDYYSSCWQEALYQGELFAVPKSTDVRLLFYNEDLLAQAGFADENGKARPPRSWQELHDYAAKMTRYENNDAAHGAVRVAGFVPIPNWSQNSLYLFAWQNGAEYMSSDGKTCQINEPRIVQALDWFTRLSDDLGGAQRLAVFQSSFQADELDPFLQDRVAMEMNGQAFVNTIANYRRDMSFAVCPPPTPTGGDFITWSGGFSYVIPRGCKHPQEAWELIKFLVSFDAAKAIYEARREERLAEGEAFLPDMHARRDVTEWAFQHYVFDDPTLPERYKAVYRTSAGLAPAARFRPVTPVGQLMWNEQQRASLASIYHEYPSARAALDYAKSVIQRRLDDIYRPRTEPVVSLRRIVAGYAALVVAVALGMWLYFRRQSSARGFFRAEHRAGVLFAAPFFIGFIVFNGGPILFSLCMSFCDYDVFNPARFVEWRNFRHAFTTDPLFWKSMGNTLFMALGIPVGMCVSLGVAMLLAHEVRGVAAYRTFFYLPAIVPVVASSLLWIWVFNPTNGLLNWLLDLVGIKGPAWLQDERWSKPSLILMGLWSAGAGMIIWLAGLKGIPEHLYDAAEIDGANAWQRFLHVTLPMLSPYIFFNLVMGVIRTFQIFSEAFIMTEGGPVDSTLFYAYHLFNNAFAYMDMGYACALAWVLFLIVFLLTMVQLKLAKHWVHYGQEM
ncbi:MAG: extracellular solute-binding protein [Candidatus Sumerlaeota bacterium]|nr:extracellular solute-binding protein [Candidatus Sumerlaeota bacterium]